MKDYIPIITAIIAFAGAALGVIIGWRKWRKERDSERLAQFEKDRQDSYKELWNRVEEFNVKVRIEDVGSGHLSQHLQELNSFILKSGIYLDDSDRDLANKYAEAVYIFQKTVRDSGSAEACQSLESTQMILGDNTMATQKIGEAQKLALNFREELRDKVRAVLKGNAA